MASVASAPRTLQIAFSLIRTLDDALMLAGKLEEVAYDEAEFGFVFAARDVKKALAAHRDALEKLIKSKTS
jgi:hypothetical protein